MTSIIIPNQKRVAQYLWPWCCRDLITFVPLYRRRLLSCFSTITRIKCWKGTTDTVTCVHASYHIDRLCDIIFTLHVYDLEVETMVVELQTTRFDKPPTTAEDKGPWLYHLEAWHCGGFWQHFWWEVRVFSRRSQDNFQPCLWPGFIATNNRHGSFGTLPTFIMVIEFPV